MHGNDVSYSEVYAVIAGNIGLYDVVDAVISTMYKIVHKRKLSGSYKPRHINVCITGQVPIGSIMLTVNE